MTINYDQMIQDINTILMLKSHYKFIGIIFYGLNKHYLPEKEYVNKFGSGSLALTNGKDIYYNLNKEFTVKTGIAITLHEILHIISSHIERKTTKDIMLWNIACDHVVNSVCREIEEKYGDLELPLDHIFFEEYHRENPNYSAEEIYEKLLEKSENNQFSYNIKDTNSKDSKSSGKIIEIPCPENNIPDRIVERGNLRKTKTKIDKFTAPADIDVDNLKKLFKDISSEEIEKNFEDTKQQAKDCWNSLQSSSTPGVNSGSLEEYLSNIFKVELPWNKVLEGSILYSVQKKGKTSWAYPNLFIRYPKLPGKRKRNKDLFSLISVIDSSGSLSTEDLQIFKNVLISLTSYFKNIYIIVHDTTIQQFINIKNPTERKILEDLKSIKGRGGTSHKEVFNKIEELVETEKISSIIFSTDFMSDITYIIKQKDYKFLREFETIWLLPKRGYIKEVELYNDSKFETIQI